MSQINIIGRVTSDFELQTSSNGNLYARLNLAENIGYGKYARTQYFQVWAWGDDAKHLLRSKVKQSSFIWITGSLELEEYSKQDGTKDKRLKVILDNWGYIPVGKSKQNSQPDDIAETVPVSSNGQIDGEREELPD